MPNLFKFYFVTKIQMISKYTQIVRTIFHTVHGSWGSWTDVSGCSHSCGGGTHYRIRMCNNPSPSFGGRWCSGNATKFQHCNTQTCPGTYSNVSSVLYNIWSHRCVMQGWTVGYLLPSLTSSPFSHPLLLSPYTSLILYTHFLPSSNP